MQMKTRNKVAVAALGTVAALVLAGCAGTSAGGSSTSNSAGSGSGGGSGQISIAYLQKQADQQYFIDEANGAKQEAAKLGVKLTMYNLGTSDAQAVDQLNAAVAQKPTGLIIVPPDGAVGPQMTTIANSANIKVISSDDQVCSNNPDPTKCDPSKLLPRVGFSGTEMGSDVGKEAGQLYKSAGWTASDTVILSEWQQDVTVCTQRVTAAYDAFKANGGDAAIKKIDVGTDNTPNGAQDKTAAILTANQQYKHWIVWGCNDENVSGAVTAMQNANISASNIIGVGLGAYLACKPWQAGQATGMKAALFNSGVDVGKTSIDTIVAWVKDGKQPSAETNVKVSMLTAANWKSSGLQCTA